MKESQKFRTEHAFEIFRALGGSLAAVKKNGVPLKLGNFQRQFNLVDNSVDQLRDYSLAVRKSFRIGRHVAGVATNIRDDENHRFGCFRKDGGLRHSSG